MKAVIPALAGALFLLGQGSSHAQQQDFSKVEIQTTELGHGVYMLEGDITVAASSEGVIMVDTQFAPMTAKIKAAIAKITPQPIRYVIDTHYHPDHTGGNANFAKDGAVIIAQENVRKRLQGNPQMAAAAPMLTYADGIEIHLGDKVAQLHHMDPAHTDGDPYVYFPDANVLATGDIFGSFRFPTGDIRGGGSVDGMLASANRLLTLVNDGTKIVPGHGPLAKDGRPHRIPQYGEGFT